MDFSKGMDFGSLDRSFNEFQPQASLPPPGRRSVPSMDSGSDAGSIEPVAARRGLPTRPQQFPGMNDHTAMPGSGVMSTEWRPSKEADVMARNAIAAPAAPPPRPISGPGSGGGAKGQFMKWE